MACTRSRIRGLLAVAGLAIVGVSLLLDRVVQFDPQGWLLWGRELTSPGLHFSTVSYPSWKPLPFLFAVPLSLGGGAAPALWLAIERSAALAGIALAYWVARDAAGRLAGLLAAGGVLLAPAWVTLAIDGRSEPLVIALLLGSLAAHRAGRRRIALTLLVLAALDRPEALAIACLYVAVCTPRCPREWGFAAALIAIVPALWLGGDWLGSGDPLRAAKLAHAAGGIHHQPGPPLGFLAHTWAGELRAPLVLGAAAGTVLAAMRREGRQLLLAAMVLAWLLVDAALLEGGYPESQMERFVLPAAALACVLGAIGLARLVQAMPSRRLRIAAALASLVFVAPFATQGLERASAGVHAAAWYARSINSLDDTMEDTGGRRALLGCGHLAVDHWAETQLAWGLDIEPDRVGRPRTPGIVLAEVGARYGSLLRLERNDRSAHVRRLRRLGAWNVLYAGRPTRDCALAHTGPARRLVLSPRRSRLTRPTHG